MIIQLLQDFLRFHLQTIWGHTATKVCCMQHIFLVLDSSVIEIVDRQIIKPFNSWDVFFFLKIILLEKRFFNKKFLI